MSLIMINVIIASRNALIAVTLRLEEVFFQRIRFLLY